MNIIFQQQADDGLRQAWPVVVSEKGQIVSGRPDADYLLGFAMVEEPFTVSVLALDVVEYDAPEKAVGKLPVYIKGDSTFVIELPVVSCQEYKGDIEALRAYGK